MPQEIFNNKEIDENKARLGALIELIRSRSAVLFMGAGCSVSLGYPDWFGLLKELEELTSPDFKKDSTLKESSPLKYAHAIRDHIIVSNGGRPDKYHNKLATLFAPKEKQYDHNHQMLVSMPFKGIVTTNYDLAIEAALTSVDGTVSYNPLQIQDGNCFISQFFLSFDFKQVTKHILHLHGTCRTPKNIILTAGDYEEAYGCAISQETEALKESEEVAIWKLHRRVLWALLATRRLVFVGFSFNDPYLHSLLELSTRDLWRWDSPVHFAIIPISLANSDKAKRRADFLRKERGVETYFYIDHDGKHTELYKVIAEIANACGISVSPDWVEDWNDKVGGV